MIDAGERRSPATLFMHYWRRAAEWTATHRLSAAHPGVDFKATCKVLLEEDDAWRAHDDMHLFVDAKAATTPVDLQRGRVLAAMAVIDEFFYAIHPRAFLRTTPTGGNIAPPGWLRDLRSERIASGDYSSDESGRLIPRGPLLRQPRAPDAASGDLLADRFAALCVVPLGLLHDDRHIDVSIPVIPLGASGVRAPKAPGAERIGFAPLATAPEDMAVRMIARGGGLFAEYGPSATFDAASKALEAIDGLADVDVVIMPELVQTSTHVEEIARALGTRFAPAPRVIVAGSYLSVEDDEGYAFNEACVLNGNGVELWRQRKLWTACVDQTTAIDYGMPDPGNGAKVFESTACGCELVVADVDALGRCVVLICQDAVTPVLAAATVDRFQPDWVFVPIFDRSVGVGRWAHSRAYGLSELSQARFIAITNTAFAGPHDPTKPVGMGFAVGPKVSMDDRDHNRAFAMVSRPPEGGPQWGALVWRDGSWETTTLGVRR